MPSDKLTVTIICTVYNHGKYLRRCLDGFVKQKTNFKFEAIVHDDASTDDSPCIIRQYAEKYPDIIKPILQTENQYSKHDGSLRKILKEHACGKYIAICEGDDFWVDPLKLQKQVDFLEAHPDTTLCFHNVFIVDRNEEIIGNSVLYKHLQNRFFNANEIIRTWTVPTCSALLKRECYLEVPYDKDFCVGDNVIWMTCLSHGDAYCIDEKMGVYRRDISGWTLNAYAGNKNKVLDSYKRYQTHLSALSRNFPGLADDAIRQLQSIYQSRILIIELSFFKFDAVKTLISGLRKYRFHFLSTFLNEVIDRIKIRIKK